MGDVTHEQVNLMLRLYDARREPLLREAREWYMSKFNPQSPEDMARLCPQGSKESAYMRMVISYWDMACSLVVNNAIDEKMFNDANGEHLVVFGKIEGLIPAWREKMGDPNSWKNLETVALGAPDARTRIDGIKARIKAMLAARAAAAKG